MSEKMVREAITVKSDILEGGLIEVIDRLKEILRKHPQFDKIWLEKNTYGEVGAFYDEYEFVGERIETKQEKEIRLEKEQNKKDLRNHIEKENEIKLMGEIAKKYNYDVLPNMVDDQ